MHHSENTPSQGAREFCSKKALSTDKEFNIVRLPCSAQVILMRALSRMGDACSSGPMQWMLSEEERRAHAPEERDTLLQAKMSGF